MKNVFLNRRNLLSFSPKPSSPSALFCSCSSGDDGAQSITPDPFILTTPLYYVNAPPHMGTAYTTIAADAITRFHRLLGKKVVFITGTDEHGEKIATAAAASGSSPIEHCNNISQAYKILWKDLDIAYDKFIRTTDSSHEEIVKEFYARVLASGDIYRANYEGLYCVGCEEYKDEKELLENNCCPMHLKPCEARKEDNYFFALSKYQKSLEEVLACNPDFVQPSYRLNEVQSWIKSGLRDFSISRASVDWGIPVPCDGKQTIYLGRVELGNDGDYSEEWFVNIVNAHLANTIGNLLNHTLGLLKKNCNSTLIVDSVTAAEGIALKDSVEKLDLVVILEVVRIIAVALAPVTPSLCLRIYSQLGYSNNQFEAITWSDTRWGGLKGGQVMAQAIPIFARIEILLFQIGFFSTGDVLLVVFPLLWAVRVMLMKCC
ncbi:hypothetical protein MKX03_001073 [Papaver bracteatum]|nr:hypothetical protein MKX03_001073 [Papaver bracteatum]